MTKNPFYNALLAIAYIIGIVLVVFTLPNLVGSQEDSIFTPMAALGLLVLSVAVMAYLFFYRPVIMLLDGEREGAVSFFLKTLGTFAAGIIVVFLISLAFPF